MAEAPHQFDTLIIGSGAAGLSIALRLAANAKVALVSKGKLTEGSTLYAQGGVSAALDPADSIEAHVQDTLTAGAGLCNERAVRFTAQHGREQIDWLTAQGVAFTPDKNGAGYHLTREGGHSQRRVVHADDATGREIEINLVARVREHPNITCFEDHIAIDLITAAKLKLGPNRVLGAYILDRTRRKVQVFAAPTVVLATGGANKVYLYTSNPDVSTGDGIAMAWRAGCRIANMEFIQFHPTCLFHPHAKSFLITEAIRGEGGTLLLPDGTRFMQRFDPRGELAPRDIVARAIDHEMKRLGADCLYLDISHKPADFVRKRFPNIYQRCLEFGYDMTQQPLPIVPAAHYTCGGIMTDFDGRTDIDGLYAAGETAYTGLHGANRLASNSLLECLVFGAATAADINRRLQMPRDIPAIPPWDESRVTDPDEMVVISHNWDELRRFMWDYVGIVRTDKRLQRAKRRVDLLSLEIDEYYSHFRVHNDLLELRNLVQVADLIIQSAIGRKESRGLHFTRDHPETDESRPPQSTILVPPNYLPPVAGARAIA